MRRFSFGEKNSIWLEKTLLPLRTGRILKILRNMDGLKDIVDIGTGYHAKFLIRLVDSLPNIETGIGVDMSIDRSLESGKIRLVQTDLNEELPLGKNAYDAVISTAVLEHLENYELALREMYRILRPGGSVFITTPSPSAKPILEFLAFKLSLLDKLEIGDHKNYFSKNNLNDLLLNAGFKNVRVDSFQCGLNNFASGKKR